MTAQKYTVPELRGERMSVEQLAIEDVNELVRAANEETSTYGFTKVPLDSGAMTVYVEDLLGDQERGEVVPFVQRDVITGTIVGMTRFMTLRSRLSDQFPYALEVGGTWLASSSQRTGINTEAKFLLLRFAFEEWGCARVELKTDERNTRSRNAISRIGATFEGVLRNYQPSLVVGEESLYRNTAIFSITSDEWPTAKAHLHSMLR